MSDNEETIEQEMSQEEEPPKPAESHVEHSEADATDDLAAILAAKRPKLSENSEEMLEAAKHLRDEMEKEEVDIQKLKGRQVSCYTHFYCHVEVRCLNRNASKFEYFYPGCEASKKGCRDGETS